MPYLGVQTLNWRLLLFLFVFRHNAARVKGNQSTDVWWSILVNFGQPYAFANHAITNVLHITRRRSSNVYTIFKQAMSFSQSVLVDFLSEVVYCSIQHFERKVDVSKERFVRQTATTSNIQHYLSFSRPCEGKSFEPGERKQRGWLLYPLPKCRGGGKRVALLDKRLSVLKLSQITQGNYLATK